MTRLDVARGRMAPGGRMWSESPIRYPRRRTATAGVPFTGTPPLSLVTGFSGDDVQGAPASLPIPLAAIPANTSHAAALMATSNYDTLTPPPGWTVVASGGPVGSGSWTGGGMRWALAFSDAAPTPGSAPPWTLSDPREPGDYCYNCATYVYFIGAQLGRLIYEPGPVFDSARAEPNPDPPGGAVAWAYVGALKGVYGSASITPATLYINKGPVGGYVFPKSTTDVTQTPGAGSVITWSTSGAYGSPASRSYAVGWAP